MGSLLSCLNGGDFEDNVDPDNLAHGDCVCLSCFGNNNISNVYTSLFRRGEEHSFSTSIEGETSLTSTASYDYSTPDMYHSPPFPLPYGADPRFICLQCDGRVSSGEKGSESLNVAHNLIRSCVEDESRHELRKSLLRLSSSVEKNYLLSEDEDVCPTCLDEYTPENPKIKTKCSHDFHLGCIYEWMERSESCPVCGKLMAFDETT